jgi:hypothetical protein
MEKSNFAKHLLDNKHSIGFMEDIMEILQITRKVITMSTGEWFQMSNKTEKKIVFYWEKKRIFLNSVTQWVVHIKNINLLFTAYRYTAAFITFLIIRLEAGS